MVAKTLTYTSPAFTPFAFGGALWDADTGLVRFGARDYNPETGRRSSSRHLRGIVMVRKVNDALAALRGLRESLLISYQYDAAAGVMYFVFDYPDQEPGADRAFVRFRFDGVSSFKRDPGLSAELQKFTDAYSTRETRRGSVLQKVNIRARGSSIRIVLGCGHSFGGVSFACRGVTAETRNAHATRTGPSEWDYRDFDDGARMDFYDPFA